MIKAQKSTTEVLNALIGIDRERAFPKKLQDEEVAIVRSFTVDHFFACQSQAQLMHGGLLHLFYLATKEDENKRFIELCEELEISKTQAYRTIRVWETFGTLLRQEPYLSMRFCQESLKILAAEHVPERARQQAMEMARRGERITIRQAARLIEENTVTPPTRSQVAENIGTDAQSASATKPQRSSTDRPVPKAIEAIEYEGKSGRIRIFPNARRGLSLNELISDLRDFIEELQSDLDRDPHVASATN